MSRKDVAGGKGDAPRPLGVPADKFSNNWDAIFGKKMAPEPEPKKENNE